MFVEPHPTWEMRRLIRAWRCWPRPVIADRQITIAEACDAWLGASSSSAELSPRLAFAVAAGRLSAPADLADAALSAIAISACRGHMACRHVLLQKLSDRQLTHLIEGWIIRRSCRTPGKIDTGARLHWLRRPRGVDFALDPRNQKMDLDRAKN